MNDDEEKKKMLVKKVELAAEEIRSKQKNEEVNRHIDEHLSVLKKREDPYKIVMKNKLNSRKRRIIVTVIIGLVALIALALIFLIKRKQKKE